MMLFDDDFDDFEERMMVEDRMIVNCLWSILNYLNVLIFPHQIENLILLDYPNDVFVLIVVVVVVVAVEFEFEIFLEIVVVLFSPMIFFLKTFSQIRQKKFSNLKPFSSPVSFVLLAHDSNRLHYLLIDLCLIDSIRRQVHLRFYYLIISKIAKCFKIFCFLSIYFHSHSSRFYPVENPAHQDSMLSNDC